jgi:K+-sensing histidine kinase KdpD
MTVARTAGFALLYVVVTYGLAICKRIVERHGGVITAGDNPPA